MRISWKIKNSGGFSLAELLVATLIMLMVASVVAGGIPVARDAYNKVTVSANAQVMLSTAITALRNELGTASDVSVNDKVISYTSAKTGGTSKIYLNDDGEITIEEYVGYDNADSITPSIAAGTTRQLVDDVDEDLYITYDDIGFDSGIITFFNLKVKSADDASSSISDVKLSPLQIRVIRAS